jgi:hypothetical protein
MQEGNNSTSRLGNSKIEIRYGLDILEHKQAKAHTALKTGLSEHNAETLSKFKRAPKDQF